MKKWMKWLVLALALAASLFLLTGCQESNEAKYSRAQKLLSEAKYDEAIKVFDEISTYEDSSKMSTYAKAISAAEAGNYSAALKTFGALGDFKDSSMLITYYTARQYESQASGSSWSSWILAAETYDTLALFRDSAERAASCRKQAYDEAVHQAETAQYAQSMEILSALGSYEDSPSLRRYYEAFNLEKQQKYSEASTAFAALGDYKDSKDQAQAVLKRGYDQAETLKKAGKQEEAYTIFMNLGDYSDAFERANKPYYDLGLAKREAGEWAEAVAAFAHAGNYKDAKAQIPATNYMEAEARRAAGDWDGAVMIFTALADYSDAATQVLETRYQEGIAKQKAQDWDGAVMIFTALTDYSDAATQILETRYLEAEAKEKAGDQEGAYSIFMSLAKKEYRDSFDRANKPYYDLGQAKREAGEWKAAREAFVHAGDYSDAKKQILATSYMEAEALRAAGGWDDAVAAFEAAGDYSDAKTQILETRYQEGIAKQKAQDWDGAVTIFTALADYSDAKTQILETKYLQAKSIYDSGDFATAYEAYKKLSGYKDVDSLLQNDEHLLAAAREAKLAPYKTAGSIVTFGQYEQDNNTGNGQEAIEWIVLDVQDGKSLLLSKYGLDAKPYNTKWTDITWEKCTLRNWLNNDFLNAAFTDADRSAILMTNIDNSSSQGYSGWSTSGGNNTQDQIFLLSYAEANKYLGVEYWKVSGSDQNIKSRVAPTAYAKTNGAFTSDSNKTADGEAAGWWWLRSPGYNQDSAAYVSNDGSLISSNVGSGNGVARPAFWLNLESDIF